MHPIAESALSVGPDATPLRSNVSAFYGDVGPLAALGWEIRPQQVAMSAGIVDLVEGYGKQPERDPMTGQYVARMPKWGFAEGPCGVGKGLAYGVPGVLMALRARVLFDIAVRRGTEEGGTVPKEPAKLIVSTANIALQEQLVKKDFPALAQMLGIEGLLKVVLLKSRQNYLCHHRLRALGGELLADEEIKRLLKWSREPGCTGDKEDLTWDPGWHWQDVSVGTEDCLGIACPHYEPGKDKDAPKECFWRKAIKGHTHAHVVVTNHHYLCLARGLKACLLAVDESHDLEDCLRSTATMSLTPFSGRGLASKLALVDIPESETKAIVDRPVAWLMGRAVDPESDGSRCRGPTRHPSPETGRRLAGPSGRATTFSPFPRPRRRRPAAFREASCRRRPARAR